jgi:hypothetical protein
VARVSKDEAAEIRVGKVVGPASWFETPRTEAQGIWHSLDPRGSSP